MTAPPDQRPTTRTRNTGPSARKYQGRRVMPRRRIHPQPRRIHCVEGRVYRRRTWGDVVAEIALSFVAGSGLALAAIAVFIAMKEAW